MKTIIASVVAITFVSWLCVHAQTSRPAFEVASVKQNKSANARPEEEFFPNRYVGTYLTLRTLIHAAYGIPYGRRDYLAGGPVWMDSERFDVEGKVEEGTIPADSPANDRNERIRARLQTLLAERFQLTVHREIKEVLVYDMVVAKNGPKLQKAAGERECPGIPFGSTACAGRFTGGMRLGLSAKAVDLSELAQFLSAIADRPVMNRTGIIGLFDIKTTPFKPAPGSSVEGNADPESVPTIFTMLPEQLGLASYPVKRQLE